jgi:hypothetical protein
MYAEFDDKSRKKTNRTGSRGGDDARAEGAGGAHKSNRING